MTELTLVKRRRNERGAMMLLLMFLLVPILVICGAISALESRQMAEGDAARGRARALFNAESGIDRALARLLVTPTDFSPLTVMDDNGTSVRFKVTFDDLGKDLIDNDGDSAVDEADEKTMVRLTSTGAMNVAAFDVDGSPITAGGKYYTKQVRAIGQKMASLPSFPYALYLDDPFAQLQLNGNAFKIDGNDYDEGAVISTRTPVMGIATTGSVAAIKDQISKQQKNNVLGAGGTPSVLGTSDIDIPKIINDYKSAATIVMDHPSSPYSGMLGDPDKNDYQVTYVKGSVKFTGGGGGAGVLLVDGNLDITGAWDFEGLVVVTGQVIFRGGGGTKRVVGTVLVGGDVQAGSTNGNSEEDVEVSGTVDVLYSSTIQQQVSQAMSKFTLSKWQEL